MKLQKMLSTMEISRRIRKVMINMELYEDRKVAHRLQKEVGIRLELLLNLFLLAPSFSISVCLSVRLSVCLSLSHTHIRNHAHTKSLRGRKLFNCDLQQ